MNLQRRKQTTIQKPVQYSGISIHKGNEAKIVFRPAPVDYGRRFVRKDLPGNPVVTATTENVVDVTRGTTIAENGIKVHTVEHVLAALSGCGIDNVIMELDANEPPVSDGSARHFVELIESAGIQEYDEDRVIPSLKEPIWIEDDGSVLIALPSTDTTFFATISYNHKLVPFQYGVFHMESQSFKDDISSARTFCFYNEVETLMEKGLIKGGSLENAVVIGDDAIFSKEALRFGNEFALHKILDLIGDLSLAGAIPKAHYIAIKPGHGPNIKLAKKLKAHCAKGQVEGLPGEDQTPDLGKTVLDVNDIMKILPHRYPFLLVDRIIYLEEDKRVIGLKNVTMNENFFNGHFPGRPIMPGVLQVEAMAQVAGVLMLRKVQNKGKIPFFMGMDKVKFRKPVLPGDQLVLDIEVIKIRSRNGKVYGRAFVDNRVVSEAELIFAMVDM